ncbi:MAG: 2,4-dihydroxyhept-2-ene-1,7-dioic acid aldolase [Chloroflexi bacterium]|nr:MAG: 2,4-dihydroxyhept-2-ene-1,7-dioic acid aldolase [Chloroflexota bacterium]
MRPNRLRELLAAGRPSFATHLHNTWPSVVEIVGHTGVFDYVEFSAEYAPFDLFGLDNFCRAAELFDLGAMIKLDQEPRRFLAQRAIGSGFQSVLFADVRNRDDALECVMAVRPDSPDGGGTYGAADRRMSYYGQAATASYVQALQDVVVVLMIEKRSAVEQLDEILSVPGIDMIQWGPADYAMSVGRPGGWIDPEIRAVERRVIDASHRAGIPARAELTLPSEAGYYLDLGVRHFCIGSDLNILHEFLKRSATELRSVVDSWVADATLKPAATEPSGVAG